MRKAFSLQHVAGLLCISADEARSLVARALGGPRDLLTAEEFAMVKRAHQRRDSQAQQEFDFFGKAELAAPFVPPSPLRQDAERLFSSALALEESNPSLAVDAYTEAVAADPHHADAHVNLGRLLHDHGHVSEAAAHYVAALVSRPADVTAMFNLAVALEDQGRVDEAVAHYCSAIEADPLCVDAYFNLARLYEKKGEKLAAIRHLKDYRRLTQHRQQ